MSSQEKETKHISIVISKKVHQAMKSAAATEDKHLYQITEELFVQYVKEKHPVLYAKFLEKED
ncbi:hypothetical protein ACFOQM_04130 [Paenibacillus sp. GCM10012307]|uniref:Uncharacterized protein n=1 Tax=Paenibacillus roseus TaxID=2798579 RepID=A0A934J464_9BACL|nr:hypothetical protein [Paenibacillus roseus]MBJ6360501.1 hypothetical protein [Paenibacillus roseus]